MTGPAPHTVRLRMYQVGFGDCFLLSAEYGAPLPDGRAERHLLLDCGSTRAAAGTRLDKVVELIDRHTSGQLDVLVVTHRHKDHLSAFGLDAPGERLQGLRPKLVLRSWTEDPAAAADATGPAAASHRLAAALRAADTLATALAGQVPRDRGARGDLAAAAAAQLANAAAISRLDAMAAAGQPRYLSAGQPSGIEDFIPGVTAHVLGPPTVEQWRPIASQAADSPEYWIAQARLFAGATAAVGGDLGALAVDRAGVAEAGAGAGRPVCPPGPARWLVDRMADRQVTSLQRIVRSLDDAMNNTSLLLLLDVAGQRLLFPGDAQIENWSFALSEPATTALLRDVTLYKVGHHGSRNGTPRSLVRLWRQHPIRRTSVLSTLPGVHGKTEGTQVPRTTLVDALAELGTVHRSDELPEGEHYLELECRPAAAEWVRRPVIPD